MQSKVIIPQEYLDALSGARRKSIQKLREQILDKLYKGCEEAISYGMLGYYDSTFSIPKWLPLQS